MRRLSVTLSLLLIASLFLTPTGTAGAASDPTSPEEMLWIYELNLIRWNPSAYGLDTPAMPPVAVNRELAAAAEYKADYYAQTETCPHHLPIWSNRAAKNHGFPLPWWWNLDQNYIEASWCSNGASPIPDASVFVNSSSAAHRNLILGLEGYAQHREIGVGFEQSTGSGLSVMVAPRDGYDKTPPTSPMFITGVVFDDANGNGRMDLGEGTPNAQVTVGSSTATTNPGGGYSVRIPSPGTFSVSSPGAGSGSVTVIDENVGVDFVEGRSIPIVRSNQAAERWWGANRYETAVAVSQNTHPNGADVVYVSVGDNYADAIAAGPAAARSSAPILLTRTGDLPGATRNELVRLAPDRVVIAGGPDAISNSVENQIRALLGSGTRVDRVWGQTRYETAVELSRDAFTKPASVDTVFVATGQNFADALVGAPAAIAEGAPLLLVLPTSIPAAVADEIARLKPSKIYVLGGTSAVSSGVFGQLDAMAGTVQRISAADRYAMSAKVSSRFFSGPVSVVYVAVGDDYPDALAGGAASGTNPGPILLTRTSDLPTSVATELLSLTPAEIVILGGPVAVSDAVATELSHYVG